MRDSWIDKKELEELVGEFSSAKGKSRRGGPAQGRRGASVERGPSGAESTELKKAADGTDLGKIELDVPENPGKRSILHDISRLEDVNLETGSDVPLGNSAIAVCEPIVGRAEENGQRARSDSTPAGDEVDFFRLDGEDEGMKGASIVEPEEEVLRGKSSGPGSRGATAEESFVSNLTVEASYVEGQSSRIIPTFFRETAELPDVRQPLASGRDADRAINALAEARSIVNESRLLEIGAHSEPALSVPQIENQEEEEETRVSASAESDERRRINPEAGLLYARLEDFGDSLQRVVGASEVAVCDSDGFLLYQSSEFRVNDALHRSLLLQVSGRLNTFLALGGKGVSQMTGGDWGWHCLISGDGPQGELFAGFTLPKPLEQGEVDVWKDAWIETIAPTRRDN